MNLRMGDEVAEEAIGIDRMLAPMFEAEYSGLAPGTQYLEDWEFAIWFEAEAEKRPNMIQMLAMQGAEGRKELRRYARITGRETLVAFMVGMFSTEDDRDGADY